MSSARVDWTETSKGDVTQLFTAKSVTDSYAKFRPTYPDILFEVLVKEVGVGASAEGKSGKIPLAVDIACGSGQATAKMPLPPLSAEKVVGLDVSAQQIKAAVPQDNVIYGVGTPETAEAELSKLGLATPVPLVTVAQAFHWFNFPVALAALHKLVTPDTGVFATFGYREPELNTDAANKIVSTDFYRVALDGCWTANRLHIEDGYQAIEKIIKGQPAPHRWAVHRIDCGDPSKSDKDTTYVKNLAIERDMTVRDFCGYLASWSGYGEWLKRHRPAAGSEAAAAAAASGMAQKPDPLDICRAALAKEYGGEDAILHVSYSIFVLVCRPLRD